MARSRQRYRGCSVNVGCGLGAADRLLVTEYGAASVIGIASTLLQRGCASVKRASVGRPAGGGDSRRCHSRMPVRCSVFQTLVQIPTSQRSSRSRSAAPGGRLSPRPAARRRAGIFAEMLEFFRSKALQTWRRLPARKDCRLCGEVHDRHVWYQASAVTAMEGLHVIVKRIGAGKRPSSTTGSGCWSC